MHQGVSSRSYQSSKHPGFRVPCHASPQLCRYCSLSKPGVSMITGACHPVSPPHSPSLLLGQNSLTQQSFAPQWQNRVFILSEERRHVYLSRQGSAEIISSTFSTERFKLTYVFTHLWKLEERRFSLFKVSTLNVLAPARLHGFSVLCATFGRHGVAAMVVFQLLKAVEGI